MRTMVSDTERSGGVPGAVARKLTGANYPVTIRMPDGHTESFGDEPRLEVVVLNDRGLKAIATLNELRIVDSYLDGDLDLVGDLVAGMDLRELLSDTNPLVKAWTFLQP